MKKSVFTIIGLFFVCAFRAQIIFCPPGAEWRYNFIQYFGYAITNETITYTGKTVVANDTVKVLQHRYSFHSINDPTTYFMNTWIKQRGDTIFFQNQWTQNTWQILYNFNVFAGQSWTGIYYGQPFTVNVDSIKTITLNSKMLKELTVSYSNIDHPVKITERFGCSEFMFEYMGGNASDGGMFQEFLCYKDSTFGSIQFTNKPCDFVDYVGLTEESFSTLSFIAFPNPTDGKLNLDFFGSEHLSIVITNALGQEVYSNFQPDTQQTLDLTDVPAGIYFCTIQHGNQRKAIKVVKN